MSLGLCVVPHGVFSNSHDKPEPDVKLQCVYNRCLQLTLLYLLSSASSSMWSVSRRAFHLQGLNQDLHAVFVLWEGWDGVPTLQIPAMWKMERGSWSVLGGSTSQATFCFCQGISLWNHRLEGDYKECLDHPFQNLVSLMDMSICSGQWILCTKYKY